MIPTYVSPLSVEMRLSQVDNIVMMEMPLAAMDAAYSAKSKPTINALASLVHALQIQPILK